jgi:hypothetical protein
MLRDMRIDILRQTVDRLLRSAAERRGRMSRLLTEVRSIREALDPRSAPGGEPPRRGR